MSSLGRRGGQAPCCWWTPFFASIPLLSLLSGPHLQSVLLLQSLQNSGRSKVYSSGVSRKPGKSFSMSYGVHKPSYFLIGWVSSEHGPWAISYCLTMHSKQWLLILVIWVQPAAISEVEQSSWFGIIGFWGKKAKCKIIRRSLQFSNSCMVLLLPPIHGQGWNSFQMEQEPASMRSQGGVK